MEGARGSGQGTEHLVLEEKVRGKASRRKKRKVRDKEAETWRVRGTTDNASTPMRHWGLFNRFPNWPLGSWSSHGIGSLWFCLDPD